MPDLTFRNPFAKIAKRMEEKKDNKNMIDASKVSYSEDVNIKGEDYELNCKFEGKNLECEISKKGATATKP